MLLRNSDLALAMPERSSVPDEIPSLMRAELNAEMDREALARMRDLARKKRMRRPHITEEEMADYLALAENFPNFQQWLNARRHPPERTLRNSAGWIAAAAVILAMLAALLLVTIATGV